MRRSHVKLRAVETESPVRIVWPRRKPRRPRTRTAVFSWIAIAGGAALEASLHQWWALATIAACQAFGWAVALWGKERFCLFATDSVIGRRSLSGILTWPRREVGHLALVGTYGYPRRFPLRFRWLVVVGRDGRSLGRLAVPTYEQSDLEAFARDIGITLSGSWEPFLSPKVYRDRFPSAPVAARPQA